MFKKALFATTLTVLSLGVINPAKASIFARLGSMDFDKIDYQEDFESYDIFTDPREQADSPKFNSPGGFTFDLPSDYSGLGFVIAPPNSVGFATKSLYQNGGATNMTSIKLTNGDDISHIELKVSNGFIKDGVSPLDPHNVWVRTYNDGIATGYDFEFSGIAPAETISVWAKGKVFDELRIQAYANKIFRAEHQWGAVAIDDIIVGTSDLSKSVPEPTSIISLLLVGLATTKTLSRKKETT